MSELGPDLLPVDIPSPSVPSPTPSLSPPPTSTPTHSPPAQVPPSTSPLSVTEMTHHPNTDDPFLVNFADLDGLLNESILSESPSSPSPDVDSNFVFPLPESQEDTLLDLSECLSLCSPSLSPSSTTHTPLEPAAEFDSSPSQLAPHELLVLHDHSYTSVVSTEPFTTSITVNHRKRKASDADSVLTTSTSADPPKKVKQMVKDEKYHVRRHRNNIASQVSRSKRRAKHKDMFLRVKELEAANVKLKEQVKQMEAEAAYLRSNLVQKLAT